MDEKKLFLKKFENKLKEKLDPDTLNKLGSGSLDFDEEINTADYEQFRKERLPKSLNLYEKTCNFSEKVLNVKPDKKTEKEIEQQLYEAHLSCSATGVQSAALLFPLIIVMIGLVMFMLYSTTIGIGILFIGLGAYFAFLRIPKILSSRMKAKASDEVIIAIFYIVAFMRFNSNFELAVSFAANYLDQPLSLDFKRILWELENAKYPNIKNAFDVYLEKWRDENLEFLEAIYLIESSLYESEEFRRISLLDKALETILQGNYEKMLHFAQELRGKVATFNMLGIVLPILGLIILPLAASFGDPRSTWEVVFLLYNIFLPIVVSYYGFLIIFNRPAAVNSIKVPETKGKLKDIQKIPIKLSKNKTVYMEPKVPAITIFLVFLIIGVLPFVFYNTGADVALNSALGGVFGVNSPFGVFQEFRRIDDTAGASYVYGPYGLYPAVLSLFIPLAFAFGIGYYLKWRYQGLIHLRDKTKRLEKEFPSATFQLGNRINEGISAELSFGIVADTMKGTQAGEFFSLIDKNIKFNGMSVEKAIFDTERGAINSYPSDIVISSMKIFIKSIEKGPEIGAKTLIDLSKYLSEIHSSNERMIDLLAESIGSMKSQASFLAPIISAVVIAIVSLVTQIMGTLAKATQELADDAANQGLTNFLGESIPTYLFQVSVGVYIVSLIAILVYITTNLENGEDPINTKYQIGKQMIGGLTKYSILVLLGVIGFAFIGSQVLGSIA